MAEKQIYVGIVDKKALIMSRKEAIKRMAKAIKENEGEGPKDLAEAALNALLEETK